MDGRAVFKWAIRMLDDNDPRSCSTTAALTIDDLDLVVLHQANIRILDAAAEQLGIDRQKMFVNLDRYGNTSAGSIPLGLGRSVGSRSHPPRRSGAGQRLRRRPGLGHRRSAMVSCPVRRQSISRTFDNNRDLLTTDN